MGMVKVKVYGVAASPFVATVLLCLEEVAGAVDYELVPVDMAAREQTTDAYLSRNPFGKIPAFEEGELTLFESRAIARYVLRKYGSGSGGGGGATDLLREGDLEEAAMVDLWAEVEAHHYHPPIANIVRQCVWHISISVIMPLIGGVRDQAVVDESVEKLREVLEVYEARLSASAYLAGDFVSLADLAHFPFSYCLMATEYGSPLLEPCTNVKAWWERLMARPSVKKVAALMDLTLSKPSSS